MDEKLLERISAYADGELDAAEAAQVKGELDAHPEFDRYLKAFKRLDAEAAALPVPPLAGQSSKALWEAIHFRTVEARGKATLDGAAWNEMARGLPEPPEVSGEKWARVWSGIHREIERPAVAQAGNETSRLSAAPLDADLSPINMAVVREGGELATERGRKNPFAVYATVGLLAVACALLALSLGMLGKPSSAPKDNHIEVAEIQMGPKLVDDERYFMLTRMAPELENPVVCFFLKEEEPGVNQE